VVIPSSWIVTDIYNTDSCVCMLVLSLIVLSLQCLKFFYFVHRYREFCECFVVFFDKHIFFLWASCLSSLLLLLGVLFLLVVFRIQVVCVPLFGLSRGWVKGSADSNSRTSLK